MGSDVAVWMILLLTCYLIWIAGRQVDLIDRRSQEIDRKLNLILHHLGLSPEQATPPMVIELLRAGRKIEAIKTYQKATGADLAEAIRKVESIAKQV
ncbi:hypothetical protein BH23PLA1_BH23PLA1_02120 [soil metagenome]